MKELFFIGSGKMATAIASGIVKTGVFSPDSLGAFDPDKKAAAEFSRITGISVSTDSPRSGIENSKKSEAEDAILHEIQEIREGHMSDEEWSFAMRALGSSYRSRPWHRTPDFRGGGPCVSSETRTSTP